MVNKIQGMLVIYLNLIDEKWESRDRRSTNLRWTINAETIKNIPFEKQGSEMIRELIEPYLENHIDQIEDFHISEQITEDFGLIIDLKIQPFQAKLSNFLS